MTRNVILPVLRNTVILNVLAYFNEILRRTDRPTDLGKLGFR